MTALLLAACASLLPGCCPGGVDVLSNLTLPIEEQWDACRLTEGPRTVSDPVDLMGVDRTRILDRSTAAAITELVGPSDGEELGRSEVKHAYAAVYGCSAGGSEVGVTAVVFREPTGAERGARLQESKMGVIYHGQLAAVVWTRGEGCEECYERLNARTERIISRRP